MPDTLKKLRLQGFNNLTKTLSFNIDDICDADSAEQRAAYIEYIDEAYNAERLTGILTDVEENLFHTRMAIREFRLDDYLFCIEEKDLEGKERRRIHRLVRREVAEIFYGRNLARNLEP